MEHLAYPNWLQNLLALALNDHGLDHSDAAREIGITRNGLHKSLHRTSAGIGVHTLAGYARKLGYKMHVQFESEDPPDTT